MQLIVGLTNPTDSLAQDRGLQPQDVIELPTIAEVRLSPDGRHVAYALRQRDIDANRETQSFWIWGASEGTQALRIDGRASNLRWRPDGTTISYLAPDSIGIMQVWDYRIGFSPRRLTSHPRDISSYEWSPDGERVAFAAPRVLVRAEDSELAGVIIDIERFFYDRLLAPESLRQHTAHYDDPATRTELWVFDLQRAEAGLVSDSLSVSAYAWSPDGRRVAITARAKLGRLPSNLTRHDLLLYSLDDRSLRVLAAGSGGDYYDSTVLYHQPFWSPDGTRIGYFLTDLRDRWAGSPQLGIYSLVEHRTVLLIPQELLDAYEPRPFWLHPDTVLIENTYRAGRHLFAVAISDGSVSPVGHGKEWWFDQHSFSADGRIVAFVRERIDRPPNLYISNRAQREDARQVTNLHDRLNNVRATHVERMRWSSVDGVPVEGWLYVPPGKPPHPTIVFVHGGPTWVFRNRYEPYVRYWPHALGVYANRGIAVFAANYRGTGSYGKSFRSFSALDAEPLTDIISGLDMLIRRGIADSSRLGVVGHSHGCWLGALLAVRYRRFAAGACAEGVANWASHYQRNAGWANSELLEHYLGGGASPYTEPERYRIVSPVFGFRGLQTPFLFEAGELSSLVLAALEFATAAWRAEVPHELVIYRQTDHNVVEPRVMLEVMERNLEWFEFWLLDRRETKSDSKQNQYERWRRLSEDAGWGME